MLNGKDEQFLKQFLNYMKKKNDIFFIASRSGRDNTKASFYDEKGRNITHGDVKILYKSSVSGRFVSRPYTTLLGRDSKTGEFIPVNEAHRRPNTAIIERVPKPGYGDRVSGSVVRKTVKSKTGKSNSTFKDMKKGSSISFKK